MRTFTSTEVADGLPWPLAIERLRVALVRGDDAVGQHPRQSIPVERGDLVLMPAMNARMFGVKVLSINRGSADSARVQGQYLLFSQETLEPIAVMDAAELTLRRTAGLSALAAQSLRAEPGHVAVFGSGPQARAHVEALAALNLVRSVTIHGRTQSTASALEQELGLRVVPATSSLQQAAIVVCATTAREPLFDSSVLPANATVLAVGSHTPEAREVDTALVRDSFTVVDGLEAAKREAGDVIRAEAAVGRNLVDATLSDLVTAAAARPSGGRAFFKSVGEGWQDLAVAAAFGEQIERR